MQMCNLVLTSLVLCCSVFKIVAADPTPAPDSDPFNIHTSKYPNLYLPCSDGKKNCEINVNGFDVQIRWAIETKEGIDRYEATCDLKFEGQDNIPGKVTKKSNFNGSGSEAPEEDIPENKELFIDAHCKGDSKLDVPEGTEGEMTVNLVTYYKSGDTPKYSAIEPIKAVKK